MSLGGSLALAVHFVRWHEETRRAVAAPARLHTLTQGHHAMRRKNATILALPVVKLVVVARGGLSGYIKAPPLSWLRSAAICGREAHAQAHSGRYLSRFDLGGRCLGFLVAD
jgi:hypothetical protein